MNNSFIAEVYNNEQYFGFLDHFSNILIHKICLKCVCKHKLPDDFASLKNRFDVEAGVFIKRI